MLELKSKTLVFGGPYSNYEATKAIFEKASHLGIEKENCICTGDVIAYCANPRETLDLIREWGCHVVMGNCEESLANDSDDCGCGFNEDSYCDLASKQWFDFASRNLNAIEKEWLGSTPRTIMATMAGVKLQFIHGGIDLINQFIFKSTDYKVFQDQFSKTEAEIIIAGHSGIPFIHQMRAHLWVNAGVIGMPANDGQAETWYLFMTPKDEGLIEFEFNRLKYNHSKAAAKLISSNLSEGYAKALETGLWPSLDILSETEKKQTGQPISLDQFLWSKDLVE